CAIGGITLHNAPQLIAAGADLLAVVSDLFEAPGGVAAGERMRIESVEAPERMAAAVEERLRGGVEVGG
ncbi:MAG: thiamine phosphate synthase, partial [Planctomycetaceae bacterium]|nr:thiamine phosphate synthase [Planctomycetaceae bacterium]